MALSYYGLTNRFKAHYTSRGVFDVLETWFSKIFDQKNSLENFRLLESEKLRTFWYFVCFSVLLVDLEMLFCYEHSSFGGKQKSIVHFRRIHGQ